MKEKLSPFKNFKFLSQLGKLFSNIELDNEYQSLKVVSLQV
jgi:hypothetical protein